MNLKIESLTTDRKWRASTGLSEEKFNKLLILFTLSHKELFGKSLIERNAESGSNKALIETEKELLFFTLFSLKSGLTYDLLGLVSGFDGSNAKRHQEHGLEVLKYTLSKEGCIPKREFKNIKEFENYLKQEPDLIFDCQEQRIQRPDQEQKNSYSGKKNAIH
jgi:hypothetical protein